MNDIELQQYVKSKVTLFINITTDFVKFVLVKNNKLNESPHYTQIHISEKLF